MGRAEETQEIRRTLAPAVDAGGRGRFGGGGRWWRRGTVVVCAAVVGSCGGGSLRVPPTSPFYETSLPPYDAALRHHLLAPTDAGFDEIANGGPRDEFVRLVNQALFLHRLGRFAESNTALQRAEVVAEERYTKSITQNVAAFVVSDNVLDYSPSALERSMIHYYGMLNYLALNDAEAALVEARKANALLRRYSNDYPGRSFVNDAAVQYLAGMLQWNRGDDNDAIVSLRQSLNGYLDYETRYGVRTPEPVARDVARIAAALGLDDVAEQTRARYLPADSGDMADAARRAGFGDVLIVVENGFIAHKKSQKLFIPILKSERDSVIAGSAESAIVAALRAMIRTVIVMNELTEEGKNYLRAHEDGVVIAGTALSAVGVELITLAWPAYDLDARRASSVRVTGPDGMAVTPVLIEDLSAIAVRDFEERKTTIMFRMLARGLLKEAAVIASEAAGERAGGALGGFLGRVTARTLANATERADTRSWSTLPAELLLARLRVPAGRHDIQVAYQGISGPETATVTVDVQAGEVVMRTVPVLGRNPGDRARFEGAQRGVRYEPPRRTRAAAAR